jgi:hypothetical protein
MIGKWILFPEERVLAIQGVEPWFKAIVSRGSPTL